MNWIEELKQIPIWKKYSQANEECYLDFILKNIPNKNKFLVELGAWDGFHLSNTRHFIEEQGYYSLLIDGDNHGNEEVHQHFIDADNVNDILQAHSCPDIFDLLCIDLDGNDWYVLDKVLSKYRPKVVLCEFNPIFELGEIKSIAYNPKHTWNNDDYYGFSFSAGISLGYEHGYTCIFQNDNLNMYFVRNEVLRHIFGDDVILESFTPSYTKTNYHIPSGRTDWVNPWDEEITNKDFDKINNKNEVMTQKTVDLRFNTNFPERSKFEWRVLVDGVENLVNEVKVDVPSYSTCTFLEGHGKKWHMSALAERVEILDTDDKKVAHVF